MRRLIPGLEVKGPNSNNDERGNFHDESISHTWNSFLESPFNCITCNYALFFCYGNVNFIVGVGASKDVE